MGRYYQLWNAVALLIFVRVILVMAVDRSKFRKCADTGFCRVHRNKAFVKYKIFKDTLTLDGDRITAKLGAENSNTRLNLKLDFYTGGYCRVHIFEDSPDQLRGRWKPNDVFYEEEQIKSSVKTLSDKNEFPDSSADPANTVFYQWDQDHVVAVQFQPLRIDQYSHGVHVASVNGRSMMHFETRGEGEEDAIRILEAEDGEEKSKRRKLSKEIIDYGEDGHAIYADGTKEEGVSENDSRSLKTAEYGKPESFGGQKDSKPYGRTSVGVDVTFPGSRNVFGIPEHATSLKLKATKGKGAHYDEPYRLYNLDVFEYELDEPMALYGSIPLLYSLRGSRVNGFFWFNPSETFVDLEEIDEGTSVHWISETGDIDIFLLGGPKPADAFYQYGKVTGFMELPPLFSLGYHQCRWNYRSQTDLLSVHDKFEELDIPYDVIWLDIEHTDSKKYFTWNKGQFPDPVEMQKELSSKGRKLVNIVDPHIKRQSGYWVHDEALANGYYVQDRTGKVYDGWCWPGSSSYPDFTNTEVREWWITHFRYVKYHGSTPNLFIWNDMNEPSVFTGPEVSMPKVSFSSPLKSRGVSLTEEAQDNKNIAGVEHREWHNLYGMYFHRATSQGLVERNEGKRIRPFVLTRSFFAGSQRTGVAVWTGDNLASWDHLQIASPMVLSISLCGLHFTGADVGGFFKDPSEELMIRWMQAAVFQPFFRNHAHHDSKRKEPWEFGDGALPILKAAIVERYTYLPFWYTLFHESSKGGVPPMRPVWAEFPSESTASLEDQWMVGNALMVFPVLTPGATTVKGYLPTEERWLNLRNEKFVPSGRKQQIYEVPVGISEIPVFQRGGTIIPRKLRLRRSSETMAQDPYTLSVVVDSQGTAKGTLYLDDEYSYDYREGMYREIHYEFSSMRLMSRAVGGNYVSGNRIERIIMYGIEAPKEVSIASKNGGERDAGFQYVKEYQKLVIRKPELSAFEAWTIEISLP